MSSRTPVIDPNILETIAGFRVPQVRLSKPGVIASGAPIGALDAGRRLRDEPLLLDRFPLKTPADRRVARNLGDASSMELGRSDQISR
jgi:hypothetical protein